MPKKVTVEDLARMVQRGFDETAQKADVEKLENRVYKIESAIIQISDTLAAMRKDIYEIKTRYVYRDEFEDALARLSLVEKRVGIKSGK
ncbi:MAG: hypothetical protein UW81_C0025G0009 [Candidatus Giovannonibacteria bacterium GW2011_GWC2_44_9]|uniref:Uncharacterized protein n=3 Tax=Candidatus Giovannoniibacteriota TaxID=1752738 RepID=A0A0G1KI07_9BACT|nr:MAG: hypothetical protein UW15_C0028G0009 [Parcubacteria group bacterium GW2011_GWC1_44_10]KKT60305.1 MAG: hypothetical protein UW53_C0002G0057 [Candidatus Giovannonibacteria bacterium GW2011_GWA1_44_25]KKT83130.1 MAG: hypothetical protein UW81_C0025G0009 [Candidatus Giovannonibacteria bacterium GW2011_GWC2_44_9]KKU29667.1 MAG: hypothetical protein UX43_C0007G0009 [Candidatus Giovannonibacteria bacterium GW2011_GWB1_46_20]OGF48969.1 MAG: hypothetical protein A2120_00540 [Candidatus Giovannon